MAQENIVEQPQGAPCPVSAAHSADCDHNLSDYENNLAESIPEPTETMNYEKEMHTASMAQKDGIKQALAQRKKRETLHDIAVGFIKDLSKWESVVSQETANALLENMHRVRSIDVRTDVQAPKWGQYQVCSRVDNMFKIIGNQLSKHTIDEMYYRDWEKHMRDVLVNSGCSQEDVDKAIAEVTESARPRIEKCELEIQRILKSAYENMFETNSRRRSYIPFLWKEGIRTISDMPSNAICWYQMSVAYNGWLFDRQRQGVEDQRANMVRLAKNDEDRARLEKMVEEANRLDVEIFGTISRSYVSHTPAIDPEEHAHYEKKKLENKKERAKKRGATKNATQNDIAQVVGKGQNSDDHLNNTTATTTETGHDESDDCGPPTKRQCAA